MTAADIAASPTVASWIGLRLRCPCAECRHPSGQWLLDPAQVSADTHPVEVHDEGDVLTVVWSHGGHRSQYSKAELGDSPDRAPQPWDASIADAIPTAVHADLADPARLAAWLDSVDRLGFGLLHGVPIADGEVARVAELFGFVRETNYGRWFDVRSVVDPTNLANTSLGLPAHTDNPYRDPAPTMQLLHCLESSTDGGDNVLVDGFRVADELRSLSPEGFAALTAVSVTFTYRDALTELTTSAPLIDIRADGSVVGVRFNSRSMQPPVAASEQWYQAYLLFARLLADPAFHVQLRLEAGDLFIVDNRRVLHGRTAYSATEGSRHLQGCYADIDGLRSTLAVLRRSLG